MSTPQARVISAGKLSSQVVHDDLLRIYKELWKEWTGDLEDRLRRKKAGQIWGGGENPEIWAKELKTALADLRQKLIAMNPGFIDVAAAPLDNALATSGLGMLTAGASPAVAGALAPNVLQFKDYLKKSSLVREKLLQGKYSKGGMLSPHALMYKKTGMILRDSLVSGKSVVDVFGVLEKKIWGLDYTIAGPDKGVTAWVERLLRTEYQFAHNSSRHTFANKTDLIDGYYILLSNNACEVCQDAYGGSPGQEVLHFYKDGELTPPNESHPNCECTITRYHFDTRSLKAA